MHPLSDDVTLPFFFIAPPQPLSTEIRPFLFLYIKPSTLLFFIRSIDVENQHSSLKLFSSNVKYFCFVLFNNYFCLFIRIFAVINAFIKFIYL